MCEIITSLVLDHVVQNAQYFIFCVSPFLSFLLRDLFLLEICVSKIGFLVVIFFRNPEMHQPILQSYGSYRSQRERQRDREKDMRERQRECSLQVSFLEQQLEATKIQMDNLETELQEISLYVEEIPNINNKHIYKDSSTENRMNLSDPPILDPDANPDDSGSSTTNKPTLKFKEYSNTGLWVDRSSSIATRVLAIRNQNLQLVRIGILDR